MFIAVVMFIIGYIRQNDLAELFYLSISPSPIANRMRMKTIYSEANIYSVVRGNWTVSISTFKQAIIHTTKHIEKVTIWFVSMLLNLSVSTFPHSLIFSVCSTLHCHFRVKSSTTECLLSERKSTSFLVSNGFYFYPPLFATFFFADESDWIVISLRIV
jgi:hypothetical protein